MQIGKLPNDVLKDVIISKINKKNEDILVGPEIGEDCAIIDFGEEVCVLTTDPITAANNNAGTIGVHICCNDIASAGVKPLGVMVTLLVPPTSELSDISNIMKQVNEACEELSIGVLGGHTEITDAVNKIVLSITAIGKGKKDKFVRTGGAKVGDKVIMTGYAGLEGTAILAKDYYGYLVDKLDIATINEGQNMLKNISVVKEGELSGEFGVSSMHDATEGGILGAVWEVADASNTGVIVTQNNISIKKETIDICNALKLNPYRLISSGCMIITCADGKELCELLNEHGINAAIIGEITNDKRLVVIDGKELEIAPPQSDEIYNVTI